MDIYFAGVGFHPIPEKIIKEQHLNCLFSFADKKGLEKLEEYMKLKEEGKFHGKLLLDSRSV